MVFFCIQFKNSCNSYFSVIVTLAVRYLYIYIKNTSILIHTVCVYIIYIKLNTYICVNVYGMVNQKSNVGYFTNQSPSQFLFYTCIFYI